MYYVFIVLILIVSFLLILLVLIQNSKGGGLASNFSSPGQVMGVRKTTDFLEKSTWILAIALVVFSVLASLSIPKGEGEIQTESKLKNNINVSSSAMPDYSGVKEAPVEAAAAPAEK